MNLVKLGKKCVFAASVAVATFLISPQISQSGSTSLTFGGAPAQAGWSDAMKWANDNWGAIASYTWSPWNRQVYICELRKDEVNKIREQYRDRADGVLFDRALERCINQLNLTGWNANQERSILRGAWSGRVEGDGKYNMYRRLPSRVADKFQQKRGW